MWTSVLLAMHLHLDESAKRNYGMSSVQEWNLIWQRHSNLHKGEQRRPKVSFTYFQLKLSFSRLGRRRRKALSLDVHKAREWKLKPIQTCVDKVAFSEEMVLASWWASEFSRLFSHSTLIGTTLQGQMIMMGISRDEMGRKRVSSRSNASSISSPCSSC